MADNNELDEKIFVEQVWIKKSFYGLMQSGGQWYPKLDKALSNPRKSQTKYFKLHDMNSWIKNRFYRFFILESKEQIGYY